jgi:hypothetical protein
MKRAYPCPSREEWAMQYQFPSWCDGEACPYTNPCSHKLSDQAAPEKIAKLIAALKQHYCELGRELRAINVYLKPFSQQRGEGHAAWYRRFRQMLVELQEVFQTAEILRDERAAIAINNALTRIHCDQTPNHTRNSNCLSGKAGELAAPFNARYDAALTAAAMHIAKNMPLGIRPRCSLKQELKRRATIEQRCAEQQQ